MKLINWLGALFELFWGGIWLFVLLTAAGLSDLWIELFTSNPQTGGLLAWAMIMIVAIESIRLVRFDNLAKAIKEWRKRK